MSGSAGSAAGVLAVLVAVTALLAAGAAAAEPPAAARDVPAGPSTPPAAGLEAGKPGDTVTLGGKEVTIKELDITPVVRSEYSALFRFDAYENPKLAELRRKYQLDKVIAPGKDEFDRQVILMDWVYRQFKKFGTPTSPARGAMDILKAVEEGHTFFCAHYSQALMGAAASLGWLDRAIALRTNQPGGGAPEHSITEIWSNQYRKWVMFDPTYALYVEKGGVPLSAYEIRQEWFYNKDGAELDFVIGAERKKYRRKDMPVFRAAHAGYGDLSLRPTTMYKYAFLGYIPNTDFMTSPADYANMFITKDALCDGISWHKRKNPTDPARDPYFPMNQAALRLTPADGAKLKVAVETFTPNFAGYRSRIDGKQWQGSAPAEWSLHPGTNTLEVVAVNKFGVQGPVSRVVLEVK